MSERKTLGGVLLLMDREGVVEEVVRDEVGLKGIEPGRSLMGLADHDSRDKAKAFLAEFQGRHIVAGWELQMRIEAGVEPLHFAGGAVGGRLLVFGSAALAKVAGREQFDLVVSDLGLPDGTGHGLMKELCDRYGLKGIALSGYGMEDTVRQSLDAGFAEHLVKPVDVTRLDGAIRRVMGTAQSNIAS